MPRLLSTLTLLLVGLLWLAPGFESPAAAKGLLGFGKKKKETVAPVPRSSDGTVYLTKYGPMTPAQYPARIKIEQEKVREAVRRAAERRDAEAEARRKELERAAEAEAKSTAQVTRERTKAELALAKKAAEEREKAGRIARKEAEAEKKRAEEVSKKLAAQKKADADRLRAEQAALEKEEARVRAIQLKAQKDAEKRNAAGSGIFASSRSSTKDLSPAARMIEMERIARELAKHRATGAVSGRVEVTSATSLGLTEGNAAPASTKTASSGSKIDRLNKTIFDIVRQRKGGGGSPALTRVTEGELYLTKKSRTPFYYYNPLQMVLPDLYLGEGTQVALLKRGKIWSDVRLEDGKEGVIANDFLEVAPIVEIELPPDNAVATTSRGSSGFQYTAIPKNYVPPELPVETSVKDRTPSPLLLPPLRPATETP